MPADIRVQLLEYLVSAIALVLSYVIARAKAAEMKRLDAAHASDETKKAMGNLTDLADVMVHHQEQTLVGALRADPDRWTQKAKQDCLHTAVADLRSAGAAAIQTLATHGYTEGQTAKLLESLIEAAVHGMKAEPNLGDLLTQALAAKAAAPEASTTPEAPADPTPSVVPPAPIAPVPAPVPPTPAAPAPPKAAT